MYKKIVGIALAVLYLFSAVTSNAYAEESAEISAPVLENTEAVTLMDADTGIVLYRQAQDDANYPASITKVMTALLTLELCDDLNERITFSRNAVYSLPRDASHIAMDEGETLSVYDALNGLLLSSANEVANALAEYLAGSTEDFAALMNKRAAALGAVNTHFTNPSGLFDENHTTTAYDMALIMREAVKHDEFNEIIANRRYDIAPTEKQPETRELLNSNRMIQPGEFFNEWVVGGKTGYTDEAMHTLVTYAEKDGQSLIVSAMHGTKDGVYKDTQSLLDYGFSLPFTSQIIFDNETYERTVPVYSEQDGARENIGEVTIKSMKDLTFDLPESFDMAEVRYELDIPAEISAPVMLGDEVGTVTCYIQDVEVGVANLTAQNAVFAAVAEAEGSNAEGNAGEANAVVNANGAVGASNAVANANGAVGAGNAIANANGVVANAVTTDEPAVGSSATGESAPVFGSGVNAALPDGSETNAAGANLTAVNAANAGAPSASPVGENIPFWEKDYFSPLAVPIGITVIMLLLTFLFYIRRKRRNSRTLSFGTGRHARFTGNQFYRYK